MNVRRRPVPIIHATSVFHYTHNKQPYNLNIAKHALIMEKAIHVDVGRRRSPKNQANERSHHSRSNQTVHYDRRAIEHADPYRYSRCRCNCQYFSGRHSNSGVDAVLRAQDDRRSADRYLYRAVDAFPDRSLHVNPFRRRPGDDPQGNPCHYYPA